MAKDIMENVRFLQVVQLVGMTNELAGRKTTVGKVVEEDGVRDQTRHRHNGPAG